MCSILYIFLSLFSQVKDNHRGVAGKKHLTSLDEAQELSEKLQHCKKSKDYLGVWGTCCVNTQPHLILLDLSVSCSTGEC